MWVIDNISPLTHHEKNILAPTIISLLTCYEPPSNKNIKNSLRTPKNYFLFLLSILGLDATLYIQMN